MLQVRLHHVVVCPVLNCWTREMFPATLTQLQMQALERLRPTAGAG